MLSNDDLLRALRQDEGISVPFFDDQKVQLFFEDADELVYFSDAIRSFLELEPSDRESVTRHLHAYFGDFVETAGWDWVEPAMKAMTPGSEAIWRFVQPTTIGAMESWDVGDRDRLRKFLVLEANCGWEEEHGLLLSFRDGAELVKVSGYDGHATNGHAWSDLAKDAFIYCAMNPDRSTRP